MRSAILILPLASMLACVHDADDDGFPADVDCDDEDAAVNPAAAETCNDADDDCDGEIDEDPVDGATWYGDTDGDGYGGPLYGRAACAQPDGFADNDDDCDDASSDAWPGAPELCNGADDDCDGTVDNGVDPDTWYADLDGDGYGDPDSAKATCTPKDGWVRNGDDCDDSDAEINPTVEWYADLDGDGYGSTHATTRSCEQPRGYADVGGDCDDGNDAVFPGATELCNGDDDDCDGTIDEDDAADAIPWYDDGDGDGYGVDETAVVSCDGGSGQVALPGDCDDTEATIYPFADEVCGDGIDQDCNGRADNTCTVETDTAAAHASWYGLADYDYLGFAIASADVDGDGTDDVIIGASAIDETEYGGGMVWVYSGPVTAGLDMALDDADLVFASTARAADFGRTTVAGDWDGDGATDLLVGARYGTETAGSAWIFTGPLTASGEPDELAWLRIDGEYAYDYFGGEGATGPADFDGDGNADLVLGAKGSDETASLAGSAYVFQGPLTGGTLAAAAADAVVRGGSYQAYLGRTTDGTCDLDGDGATDLFVTASGEDAGVVYLYAGPLSGELTPDDADVTLIAAAVGDGFGDDLRCVGDVNGDGSPDMVTTSPYAEDARTASAGAAYLFHGPLTADGSADDAEFTLTGSESWQYLGQAVADPGDYDDDGFADVIIGAQWTDTLATNGGDALLLYGPMTGTLGLGKADLVFHGAEDELYLGGRMTFSGDQDGDGLPELLISAYRSADYAGAAFLFMSSEL